MKFILSLILFLSFNSFACEYNGQSTLLITKKEIEIEDVKSRFLNCDDESLETIRVTFSNLEGKISTFQLKEILNIKNLVLKNNHIIIKNLNKMARRDLKLKENIHVFASDSTPSLLDFSSSDHLSLFCNSCLYGKNQNLTLNIRSLLGDQENKNLKVDFVTYFKAFKVLSNTAAFSVIPEDSIEVVLTEKIPHTEFLTNPNELKFFQTNKPLKAGTLIKMSDLSATRIIRAGEKTELILENHFIKIKTYGIPRSSGVVGEMIEVYHPEKKKKYFGKVIDINKVYVQL